MITVNKFTYEEFVTNLRLFAEKFYTKINERAEANVKLTPIGPSSFQLVALQEGRIDEWVFNHLRDGSVETIRVMHATSS